MPDGREGAVRRCQIDIPIVVIDASAATKRHGQALLTDCP
jgi:hypothetical protein